LRTSCLQGGFGERAPREKRALLRCCRPEGLSIAEGCRVMGLARSTYYSDATPLHMNNTSDANILCSSCAIQFLGQTRCRSLKMALRVCGSSAAEPVLSGRGQTSPHARPRPRRRRGTDGVCRFRRAPGADGKSSPRSMTDGRQRGRARRVGGLRACMQRRRRSPR
jgi:hypothetical protein